MVRKTEGQAKPNGQLRFAALRRVSTEQQEDKGESLRVQKDAIERAVQDMAGTIVEWYGGQEHGTPGYEKKEIERLLKDAKQHRFNALIIDRTDRWSRDNESSHRGLDVFRENSIRFFVLDKEKDLYDPADEFFINVNVTVGQYFARSIKKESRRSKVKRAKEGKPACGALPYGRTYDKETNTWGVDEYKKAQIVEIAQRYLAGEKLRDLAIEKGWEYTGLHKTLRQRCGDIWQQHFKTLDGKSVEIIETKVPRLLPESVIKKIHEKVQANKTYTHGQYTHPYLLGSLIFCKHCGRTMTGQTALGKYKYYRHPQSNGCSRPKGCNTVGGANGKNIEDNVMRLLFEMFGDPLHIQQAIERATPDTKKIEQQRQRLSIIDRELKKIEQGKARLVDAIYNGLGAEIEKKLVALNERDAKLIEERNRLNDNLETVPTPEMIKRASKSVRIGSARRRTNSEAWFEKMPYENKRALLQMIFSGRTPDDKRMGVYVEWKSQSDDWTFDIHGHLVNKLDVSPVKTVLDEESEMIGEQQQALLGKLTTY